MPHIQDATDDDIARASGGMQFTSQWVAKTIKRGRLVDAVGGAFEIEDGVWFGFLELPERYRAPSVFRHVRAILLDAMNRGATTFKATCDLRIPRAKEMMERLGFEPTDEIINGEVVWKCQALKHLRSSRAE